jgi:hypothetical protein
MTYSSIMLAVLLVVAARPADAQVAAPYGIDQRPQPRGTDLDSLLPVGAFARAALPPDARLRSDQDLNVTYGAGSDSVFVGLSLPESVADAHEAVEMTRTEAIASKVDLRGAVHRTGKDPSWFKTAKFLSWTRGPYFFYADGSSPEALDRFMKAFPY